MCLITAAAMLPATTQPQQGSEMAGKRTASDAQLPAGISNNENIDPTTGYDATMRMRGSEAGASGLRGQGNKQSHPSWNLDGKRPRRPLQDITSLMMPEVRSRAGWQLGAVHCC